LLCLFADTILMKMKKTKNIKTSKGFSTITSNDDLKLTSITPHAAPIFASSTYVYESAEKAQRVFEGKEEAFIYSRWSHPNAELVEKKLEDLETYGTDTKAKALVFSSGMSALSALFQSVLKPGDTLLAQGNIYGTSVDYFNHYGKEFGIEIVYADFSDVKAIDKLLRERKRVKLMYIETPSNPTIRCYDLKALSEVAKKHGIKTAVDNTFASPYLQQPFKFGMDFIVHSSTKYLNGHGTGLSGFLIGRDVAFMRKEVWKIRKLNGTICSPFDAWMLNVGMKTLSLRMEKHCSNALLVAEFLKQHKAVSKVNYLGLKSDEGHDLAKKQMRNFGGVLSFELKDGYKAGKKLMSKVNLCKLTASLGTIDTLIQHPASMSHYFVPKKQREAFGITDGLIRLSVGIEDAEDIIADLQQAL
jgi:methionine-gamma-lyase